MIQFCRNALLCFAVYFICIAAPLVAAPAPGGGGTTVTVNGLTVTITVNMDICCLPEDASQRAIFEPLVLGEIKAAQDKWNQALADLPAKGCYQIKVNFNARWLKKGEAWDNGYHHITFDFTSQSDIDAWESANDALDHPLPDKYRPGIVDPDHLQNEDDDAPYTQQLAAFYTETTMTVGTFAHESGHLMGLNDDYFEKHGLGHRAYVCLPGREGDPEVGTLMCDSKTGIIDQDLADRLADILNSDGLLPQCWKGTMKISMNRANQYFDSWTADMKVLLSEKGVASGTGTANRASEATGPGPVHCPGSVSVQRTPFNVAGEGDRQSLRLRFHLTSNPENHGKCDVTAFTLYFPGSSPEPRTNTIPLVRPSRAEGHLEVSEGHATVSISIDAALDCTTCGSHVKQVQPDGSRK